MVACSRMIYQLQQNVNAGAASEEDPVQHLVTGSSRFARRKVLVDGKQLYAPRKTNKYISTCNYLSAANGQHSHDN